MSTPGLSEALAAASMAMVRGVDAGSIIHVVLADAVRLLGARSGGIIVRVEDGRPELLAASSHQAEALESLQAQDRSGPCLDVISTGEPIHAALSGDLEQRWPGFGDAMRAAGYDTIHGTPMRWRGLVFGGLNLFWDHDHELSAEDDATVRAFADIATVALVQTGTDLDSTAVVDRVHQVLADRVAIERAKGYLAETEKLDPGAAFERLSALATERGEPLTATALAVLDGTSDRGVSSG